jgi:hypothetical protein
MKDRGIVWNVPQETPPAMSETPQDAAVVDCLREQNWSRVDLAREVVRLRAERDALREAVPQYDEVAALRAEVERLRTVLDMDCDAISLYEAVERAERAEAALRELREWHKNEYQSNPDIDARVDAALRDTAPERLRG